MQEHRAVDLSSAPHQQGRKEEKGKKGLRGLVSGWIGEEICGTVRILRERGRGCDRDRHWRGAVTP
jgi:hypothetical protein